MNRTPIDYLTHTWNPIAMRCAPVSEGCANCWHIRRAKMLAANEGMDDRKRNAWDGGKPHLCMAELGAPSRRKKPARIGVQFMGDLAHKDIPFNYHRSIFFQMYRNKNHTFLLLTKRIERMAEIIYSVQHHYPNDWPFPNVWLGISISTQEDADRWIPIMLQISAAVRFVSVEPMLGPADLNDREFLIDKRRFKYTIGTYLDWVICGAETGPGARPMKLEWPHDFRDQCKASGTPFFFKSAGNNIATPPDLMIQEYPA